MASPIEIILIPTVMILLGYMLKDRKVLKSEDSKILSDIVLLVSLPSLIFINISKATISPDMLQLPVIGMVLSFVLIILSALFCRFRGYSEKKTWTIVIASSMMNTGFLGFPITLGVFGNTGFLRAIFFDLSTTLRFILFGMVLVGFYGGNRKDILKESISFVPLWAILIGLIFNVTGLECGYVVETTLDYLSQATIPLIMMSLGLKLDFSAIKNSIGDSLFVSFIKLILAPLIIFYALTAWGYGGLSFQVAVLEAGMSTAMNALVLSIKYDLDSELMSSIVFTDTVLSLFTLTALISLLT